MSIKYPYSKPNLDENDIAAVVEVLRSGQLTQGNEVAAFERDFSTLVDDAEVVVCSNGTTALHLAYLAVDLGPTRGLLTSPITFLSTASAARMTGAPVVFADVDPRTGNLDPESVRQTLKEADVPIAAITAVHMGGRPCDLPALRKIAEEFDCKLIEDACHGVGASYLRDDDTRAAIGSCADSDLATFSFHAIKHIAMGEGGCVTTRDPKIAEKMRLWRSHGMTRDQNLWTSPPEPDAPWYYEMSQLGWNYRLTDFQCALGRGQIGRIAKARDQRTAVTKMYEQFLAGTPNLVLPAPLGNDAQHAWHLYTVFINFDEIGKSRSIVMKALADCGIGTQVHYIPLHHQPYFRTSSSGLLGGAERYYAQALSLPLYLGLDEGDVHFIADQLKEILS